MIEFCSSGKIRHASRQEARMHYVAAKTRSSDGLRREIYRCRICGDWHFGAALNPAKKRRLEKYHHD